MSKSPKVRCVPECRDTPRYETSWHSRPPISLSYKAVELLLVCCNFASITLLDYKSLIQIDAVVVMLLIVTLTLSNNSLAIPPYLSRT